MTPRTAPWLSDEQQRVWRAFLRMTSELAARIERDLQAQVAMPHTYYQILALLSEAPDRTMRMSELARVTNSSQSRLSHAASRLAEQGWLRREPSPADGRGQLAVLTDTGFQALAQAAPGHANTVRATLFDPLRPEQLTAFGDVCSTVLAAMDCPDTD